MLIKLGPDGLHWTQRPAGLRFLAEERKRLDARTEEVMEELTRRFGLKWEETEEL